MHHRYLASPGCYLNWKRLFTFAETLILVSALILGGINNARGTPRAATTIMIIPAEIQFIEVYRFRRYALLAIIILMFRPAGTSPAPCATITRPRRGSPT